MKFIALSCALVLAGIAQAEAQTQIYSPTMPGNEAKSCNDYKEGASRIEITPPAGMFVYVCAMGGSAPQYSLMETENLPGAPTLQIQGMAQKSFPGGLKAHIPGTPVVVTCMPDPCMVWAAATYDPR